MQADPSLPALPEPVVIEAETPEVSDQRSDVSGREPEVRDQTSEVRAEPVLTSELRPLTSEPDFRPLTSRPDPPPPSAGLSDEQQRELDGVLDAVRCPVRQRILLDLADTGTGAGGRANVGLLARRTGIDVNTLSTHLGKLRDKGLLFSKRQGKEVWYEAAPAHVRCQRTDTETTLTITARSTGIAVTIHLPEPPTIAPANF